MEQAGLYEEFTALVAARNLPRLRRLADSISDSDPRAPEMLNCIGFSLCLDAKDLAELNETIRYLERAASLSAIPLVRAKTLVNLAGFYTWLDKSRAAITAAENVLRLPLEPGQEAMYALAHHHAGQAWLQLGSYEQARWALRLTVTRANGHPIEQHAHVTLANFAAAQGDLPATEEHTKQIVDAAYKVHIKAIQARLAMAEGRYHVAQELSYESMQRFTAMEIRPSTRFNQFEARLLYAKALSATGDEKAAERVRETVLEINGGIPYRSVWEGLA